MIQDALQYFVLGTTDPQPGTLVVAGRSDRLDELGAYEREQHQRTWQVRAILSDHIPLAGALSEVLARPAYHQFFVNENPLTIYLHSGGRNAIYYDLVSGKDKRLVHVEVRVETAVPLLAFFHGRQAINELLDALTRMPPPLPLTIQRLELISPRDNAVLAYQLILPYEHGVSIGPLGGFQRSAPFAPYEAIFREAITSTSPFYRLLCACRVYEGSNTVRRWMKEQRTRFNLTASLPKDPDVDTSELRQMGLDPTFCNQIHRAKDLFDKLRDYRNGIAHFLIEGKQGDAHMYIADSNIQHQYFLGATVLLRYARIAIDALRQYYSMNLEQHFMRGAILPMLEQRDDFNVRASQ